MSAADIEEEVPVMQQEDSSITETSNWKPGITYAREFLLSLSGLDVCKKLPQGFDESLLSEFEESSYGTQDRPRIPGSSSLPGFRRPEYGSSPPTRGDSGNYSRGLNRWDSRSSGRSDGDSDSDSGRRYGNQARRSWQNPEHDGLLGSGSFPRPPGHAAGAAVPRFRPNENAPLNKSNEPYHPPRPYKAVPHSRREVTDSLNDETFGSSDSTSEDRAEEEKKRRAEFELMRKEHHKAFHEKQKSNPGKPKDSFSEMAGLLGNPSDSKIPNNSDKVLKQAPQDDAGKLPVSSQAVPIRPLVPPGFVSSVTDKSSTAKSLVHADVPLQVGNLELEGSGQNLNSIVREAGSTGLYHERGNLSNVKGEKGPNLSSALQGVDQVKTFSLSGVDGVLENGEIFGPDSVINGQKVLGEPARSTSILDKLFGNALPASSDGTSNFVENHDPKPDDIWSADALESKFVRWFVEEGKKPLGDVPSEKSNSLLSLIVGGERSGSDGSDASAAGPIFPPDLMSGQKTSKSASSAAKVPVQIATNRVPESKRAVLTCEDLEQSILSGIGGNVSNSVSPEKEQDTRGLSDVRRGPAVDNLASQHLLSLLQRGISSNDTASIHGLEETISHQPGDREMGKVSLLDGSTNTSSSKVVNSSDKTLTLEALFGTAFMKELHSTQVNSVGSARMDDSESMMFPSKMNESGNGVGGHEGSISAYNDRITNSDKVSDWLGFQGTRTEGDFSRLPVGVDNNFSGFDGGVGVKLPEEDSLINLIDPINAESNMSGPNTHRSSNIPANVFEKLAVLGGAIKDDRSMVVGQDLNLPHGPYDMAKPGLSYQNLHPQTSGPQVHGPPMNHGRSPFHPSDAHPAHLDPHLKFMPPEAVIHRNAPTHHQFPENMGHPSFSHPSAGLPGFDHPIPPPVLQQMHMAGNLPPPHLARGFPGAAPIPPHPNRGHAGFIQDHNPMQGFPFGQRQPNFSAPGMAPSGPGPEVGVASNSPDAFHKLLEMELRANPNQIHPFAAGGPSRAMYGHELDTGFRYR